MSRWDGRLRMLARQRRGELILCSRDDVDALQAAVRQIGTAVGCRYASSGGANLSPAPPPSHPPPGFTWVYVSYDPKDMPRS